MKIIQSTGTKGHHEKTTMILSESDRKLFFALYIPLLGYANRYDGKNEKRSMNIARDMLFSNPQIMDDFIKDNPAQLTQENLAIVRGWKKFIMGTFLLLNEFKKYSIFLRIESHRPVSAYGVVGLTNRPRYMSPGFGTVMHKVVLLPFKDQIIWDGLLYQGVICGRNYMQDFKQVFRDLKKEGKLIEKIS